MNKIGLCFSGGGARGPYQIGAVVALDELGLYEKIRIFSGASIGAANASILASTSIENAKNIWFNMPKDPIKSTESLVERLKKESIHIIEGGLRSMDFFESVLMENVDIDNIIDRDVIVSVSETGEAGEGITAFLKSAFDHYVHHETHSTYVDLKKTENKYIIDAIKASCSIPVVFPPVINENKRYYDGGVFDNQPIKPLIDYGCDEIILLNISMIKQHSNKDYKNVRIHEIKKSKRLGGILDFSLEHTEKLFDLGYQDTMDFFKKNSQILQELLSI